MQNSAVSRRLTRPERPHRTRDAKTFAASYTFASPHNARHAPVEVSVTVSHALMLFLRGVEAPHQRRMADASAGPDALDASPGCGEIRNPVLCVGPPLDWYTACFRCCRKAQRERAGQVQFKVATVRSVFLGTVTCTHGAM